jgi:hypothetical protein
MPLAEDLELVSRRMGVAGREEQAPAVPDLASLAPMETLEALVADFQLRALFARRPVARGQGDAHGVTAFADGLRDHHGGLAARQVPSPPL